MDMQDANDSGEAGIRNYGAVEVVIGGPSKEGFVNRKRGETNERRNYPDERRGR